MTVPISKMELLIASVLYMQLKYARLNPNSAIDVKSKSHVKKTRFRCPNENLKPLDISGINPSRNRVTSRMWPPIWINQSAERGSGRHLRFWRRLTGKI